MSRRVLIAGAVAAAGLAAPATAAAHGLVGRQDLPIPRWLFAWAAAVVLVASFAALAVLWPAPRLQQLRERRVARIPVAAALDAVGGAIGVAVFAVVVYAGLVGSQNALENLAPSFVFYAFWVGLAFVSFLVGDVFALFNPWRAIARGASWVARRAAGDAALPEPLTYPERIGRWPAAIGILAFAWVELVYVGRDDPSTLALMALAYAAVQLVGMSLFGIAPWLRNADPFGVLFGLIARLSPLRWRGGSLLVRPPLAGAVALDPRPGTVALVCTLIGTTAYDGLSQGSLFNDVAPRLQRGLMDAGLGAEPALQVTLSIGLVAMVSLVAALYRLGLVGMGSVDGRHSAAELSRLFAHTLVPIGLAYLVAHYFSALTYQAQALVFLVSDPLGNGSDLFGTASVGIDYGWISANAIWYVQVGALVAGHVCGLVLAHDRALAVYRDARAATRSQYWMLGVMVAFTVLGLWLLSAAAQ